MKTLTRPARTRPAPKAPTSSPDATLTRRVARARPLSRPMLSRIHAAARAWELNSSFVAQ